MHPRVDFFLFFSTHSSILAKSSPSSYPVSNPHIHNWPISRSKNESRVSKLLVCGSCLPHFGFRLCRFFHSFFPSFFFTSFFSLSAAFGLSSHLLPSFPPSHLLLSFSWQEQLSQGFSFFYPSRQVEHSPRSCGFCIFLHTPVFAEEFSEETPSRWSSECLKSFSSRKVPLMVLGNQLHHRRGSSSFGEESRCEKKKREN